MPKTQRFVALFILALGATASSRGEDGALALELVESRKIWDRGAHNAFTDLARYGDSFYCVFREGSGHVSEDGKIRILRSADGREWSPVGLLDLAIPGEGSRTYDLRDPKITVAADGRLMVLGGAAKRKGRESATWHRSFVTFSGDGRTWEPLRFVAEDDRWLWRVTWHDGKAYGVSYDTGGRASGEPGTALHVSEDGVRYRRLVPRLSSESGPTEATLRFDDDGTCYCLQRRDGRPSNSALLGVSKPPYKSWSWKDLGVIYGGPDLLRIASGRWVGGGRLLEGGARTVLTHIDVEKGELTPLLELPSGGDTSYPGLLWHEGELWVSYYSSHEGKTSIYLARVRPKS